MSDAICKNCGRSFWQDEDWKLLCLDCWKARKRQEQSREAELQSEVAQLRTSLAQLRLNLATARCEAAKARPLLDRKFLRRVVSLTHPDKHGGSEAATEVTQLLLAIMQEIS